jgi:hypothetical protein
MQTITQRVLLSYGWLATYLIGLDWSGQALFHGAPGRSEGVWLLGVMLILLTELLQTTPVAAQQ